MYKMPSYVEINFSIEDLPDLRNKTFRILWGAISVGHIRDQYFTEKVRVAVRDIEKNKPKTLEHFLNIIDHSGLGVFGTKKRPKDYYHGMDRLWWSRVWNILQYGDIEIREKVKEPLLSDNPIARKGDPESSHSAAEKITKSGVRSSQQHKILKVVKKFPAMTSLELTRYCDLDRYQIARRLPELEKAGLVRKGPSIMCSMGNNLARTWYYQEGGRS